MFEVEPNLWLQFFAAPWLNGLMKAVSLFGQEGFYAAMVLLVGFGLRLRPMLGVMLALLLAGLGTHAIKNGVGLPRPVQVDARVLDKGEPNVQWLVRQGGAATAFGLPSGQAIVAARAVSKPDYGFVSGHVAAATAFCAGLLLMFPLLRRRGSIAACIAAWPALMAISRLYLGRHFLGDVVGGAILGLLAAVVAWLLWQRPATHRLALPALALIAAIAAWCSPLVDPTTTGQLLGLSLLAILATPAIWPAGASSTPAMRLLRILLVIAMYVLARLVAHALLRHADDNDFLLLPVAAGSTLFVLGGTLWLAQRFRLYPAPVA